MIYSFLFKDIHLLIKRLQLREENSLEDLLKFDDRSKNQFSTRLIRSYPPSEEFIQTLKESHSIYERYQIAIHGDSKSDCTYEQFQNFLCESSLKHEQSRIKNPSYGYGSFHLQYYLNNQMIACSVIDILPSGISSVYFYYDPEYNFLKLGVYSVLK